MAAFIERDERCIFVGNLDSQVTEEILWELFLQAGPLEAVHIPKDKETGRPKGFGFVSFSHEVSVPYTIQLMDGISLYGREINVKQAQQNTNSPGNQSPLSAPSPLFDNQNGRSSPHYGSGVSNISPLSRTGFDFRNGQPSPNSSPRLFVTPDPFLPRNGNGNNFYGSQPFGRNVSPWQPNQLPLRSPSPQLFIPRGPRHFRPNFR